ncbi:hypothetical protein BaRGS_00038222, partial [Batillaria attramentaria]
LLKPGHSLTAKERSIGAETTSLVGEHPRFSSLDGVKTVCCERLLSTCFGKARCKLPKWLTDASGGSFR